MEKPMETSGECPYESSGFFSRLFFWYPFTLIRRGAREEMKYDAMYRTALADATNTTWTKLDRAWQKELEKKKRGGSPSLRMAIARAFGLFYVSTWFLIFLEDTFILITPLLMGQLIGYFDPHSDMTVRDAYLYAGAIALVAVLQGTIGSKIVVRMSRSGITWHSSTAALIYRKTLRLSSSACAATKSGHIVDLMGSDASKLGWNLWFIPGIWEAPIHLTVVLVYSYYQMGPAVFSALVFAAVMLPFQAVVAKMVAYFKELRYKEMDKRVNTMSEIIGGMRVIKMYCWEKPFGNLIHKIRKLELKHNWHSAIFNGIIQELNTFNQRFLTATILLVYVYMNGELSAEKVFPMFALFNIVSASLLTQIPVGVRVWFESGVSIKRIEDFLQLEEKETVDQGTKYRHNKTGNPAVMATELGASWSLDASRATLKGVSFSVGKGEMMAVVGEIGAGKSSILMAVCGELPVSDGSLYCGGSIAYSSQQPWVFTASIRQNILFGKEYDEERYNEVIKACCLDKDLAVLPHGDLSLVGEKGLTLSGGQKARVGLARALYADADVYLLDDPLSAVDTHVGRELFDNCINGPLLEDKAVILVTHQLQYLQDAPKILVLHEGETQAYGSYQSLQESGIDFAKLLPEITSSDDSDSEATTKKQRKRTISEAKKIDEEIVELKKQVSQHEPDEEEREEEDRVVGSVSWRTYWQYFHSAANVCVLLILFLLCLLTQAFYNIGDWWLTVWSAADQTHANSTFPNITSPCNKTLPWDCLDNTTSSYVYLVILALMLVTGIVRTWTLSRVTINSSVKLHNAMYQAVVRAPIRFCDTNPKGRILNRFSSDMGSVDDGLPGLVANFIQNMSVTLGIITLMVQMNWYIGLTILPFAVGIIIVLTYYLKTQRQLQRLTKAGNSPVLTHLNASYEGLHTIRAFCVQQRLAADFDKHQDALCGAWFTGSNVYCWFQFYVTLATGLFCGATTFACLAVKDLDLLEMNSSEVGLILSFITTLIFCVMTTARLSSSLELSMVAAERVIRYSEIPPEAPLENHNDQPPPSWPQDGKITFDHVSFAYDSDKPLVLKNIHCDIHGREKIGIAGRTGAGKSSFIQCLFRIAEPIGEIRIDGLPINNMGLHDVRSNMAIIPQDPVLFSGTVRRNLDPFDERTDDELWQVLKEVQLQSAINEMPGGLSETITEGGSNLSVGQKQLFCLARAILRNNRILILDEATANADKKTDNLIQATIRDRFKDCTVLTIAHRLHTIMDSDRIMVLDQGQLVEFDTPLALLQNTEGLFYSMVAQTGSQEQQRLMALAEQAHLQKGAIN